MSRLTRTLRVGTYGADVEAAKRGMHRFLKTSQLYTFHRQRRIVKRTFGDGAAKLTRRAQGLAELPVTGVFDRNLDMALRSAGAYDAAADALFDEYERSLTPPKPVLIEPRQGFESLHRSLWEAYSIGRRAGLTDLGTYNPSSRLPSGAPSDHALWPAFAFDLGCSPQTGYENLVARRFFNDMVGKPEVNYVILGNKIWSRAAGLHTYTAGGHDNHVHVSGVRR